MPRRPLLASAFGATVLAVFAGSAAGAETGDEAPRARLVLEAGDLGARCISAPELEQAVQAQLGRTGFQEPATLEVSVRFEQSAPGHFRAVVTSRGLDSGGADAGAATRELEAAGDCHALDEPLALVVALLVDADPAPPEAPEPRVAPPEPQPSGPPVQDTSPVSSAPSWEAGVAGPWRFAIGAAGVVAFGLLPEAGWGAELEVVLVPPGWPALRFRALGFLPGEAHATPDAWLGLTWVYAGIGVCPELASTGRFEIGACLGADLTFLAAESHGLTDAMNTHDWGAQASAGFSLAYRLSEGFRAIGEVGTAFPFTSRRYIVAQDGRLVELYKTPPGQLLLSLGLAYRFH